MKRLFSFFLTTALLLSLAACGDPAGQAQPTESTPPATPMDSTGKYPLDASRNEAIINNLGTAADCDGNARVYYQIFVGSFSDSNGDGIGDLRGIINRFDYLNDGDPNSGVSLGVEGIWLSPIFKSPSYHKYDVTDYYAIDPQFGTMEDLQELIDLCKERDVQIILDLVINHTAKNNTWFQSFTDAHRNGNTNHEFYDFYSYSTTGEPGKTFYAINGTSEFYEGNFSGDMPELNFDNINVRQAMVDVAKFYLDMGVSGFRFDAAKYIYYGETEANTEFWKWYLDELRSIKPDIYTVAEVWDGDAITFPYFSSTNCFNFTMSQTGGLISQTAQAGDVNAFTAYIDAYLEQIQAENPNAMLCSFIANHDMDRAAGFLPVVNGRAKVGANLNILTPGSPFIYYGEEIGLKGSRGGANTDANRRLAMNWGDGDTVKDPVGANYDNAGSNGSVLDQLPNGDSLYNHYKKLIAIRKANPEIAYGDYTALKIENSKLGGFISTYNGSSVAVLHNTTNDSITIDLAEIMEDPLTTLAAFVGVNDATIEGTVLTIGSQTSVVLR